MSGMIWFDPTSGSWSLSDGDHYLEVPHWAREILRDKFERETRQLEAENAKLREQIRVLRTAYIETLIDDALRDLGIEAKQ